MKLNAFLFAMSFLFLQNAFADWQIEITQQKTFENFKKTDEVELYTGDTILHDFENSPKENHQFVLIKINVQNQDPTIEPFNSQNFTLKTNKNSYSRLKDDKFLLNYHIKPFTNLKIKKGTHEGHLLFEVPVDELNDNMQLFYNNERIK